MKIYNTLAAILLFSQAIFAGIHYKQEEIGIPPTKVIISAHDSVENKTVGEILLLLGSEKKYFLKYFPLQHRYIHLTGLSVQKSHQKQGIGTELVNRALLYGKQAKYNDFQLIAHSYNNNMSTAQLVQFYKKFGFKEMYPTSEASRSVPMQLLNFKTNH